jgi:hypothetical protein
MCRDEETEEPAPLEEEEVDGVQLGYVGKTKGDFLDGLFLIPPLVVFTPSHSRPPTTGVKQVLFERGLLDPAMMTKYSITGKVVDGVLDERTNLRGILGRCEDFRHEVTAMAELMEALGHEMEQTPKKHPELAGCGVEYSWGKSKLFFRRNNDFNPNAKALEMRVLAALSVEVLTLARVRKFHRRANEYKRAYRDLESRLESASASTEGGVAHKDIEDMKKHVRAHRCTLDQDKSFIDKS